MRVRVPQHARCGSRVPSPSVLTHLDLSRRRRESSCPRHNPDKLKSSDAIRCTPAGNATLTSRPTGGNCRWIAVYCSAPRCTPARSWPLRCRRSAQPAPNARPTGGSVVAGSRHDRRSRPTTTTIDQSTQRAAINWQSFNIGSQQTVQFDQPSSSAVALNRVVGPNPSRDRRPDRRQRAGGDHQPVGRGVL